MFKIVLAINSDDNYNGRIKSHSVPNSDLDPESAERLLIFTPGQLIILSRILNAYYR